MEYCAVIAAAIALTLAGCAAEEVEQAAPVARPIETAVVAGSAGAPSNSRFRVAVENPPSR